MGIKERNMMPHTKRENVGGSKGGIVMRIMWEIF